MSEHVRQSESWTPPPDEAPRVPSPPAQSIDIPSLIDVVAAAGLDLERIKARARVLLETTPMSHVPDAELLARLDACPDTNSQWRHRKGGLVRVLCCAIDEASLEPVVVYAHLEDGYGGLRFSRPLPVFLERFTREV